MFQQAEKKTKQGILFLSQNNNINLSKKKGNMLKHPAMMTYVEIEVEDCTDPSMSLGPRPNPALGSIMFGFGPG
jgi:hypothetical protein